MPSCRCSLDALRRWVSCCRSCTYTVCPRVTSSWHCAVSWAKVPYAPTRQEATKRRDQFAKRFRRECPDAVDILERDWDRMVTFYDFPEAHWQHLRTTNVVESPFASVRLRTDAAKRYRKVANATALIWRVLMVAEKRFRKLNAPHLMTDVYAGELFEDGAPAEQRKKIAA